MSGRSIAIYRLPMIRSAQIGSVRAVLDRQRRLHLDGSRVASAHPSGTFLIVTLANGQVYYVKAADYERLLAS